MNALTTTRNRLLRHSAIVVASTIVLPLAAQPAFAQTETSAGDVVSTVGAPVITDIVGGAPVVPGVVDGVQVDLTVKQSVIDWTHFNIVDSMRTIQFSDTTGLPAGTVVSVLNRVVGSVGKAIETSVINGTLKSDSNVVVWISNPNGITFGSTGVFSGGSLVLTTAAITDPDFTDNNQGYTLTGAPYFMLDKLGAESSKAGLSTITLANGSSITTSGDFVGTAQNITASGTVKASGEVALIAAQDIDLAINPGSPIGYTIKAGTTVGSAKLRADGSIEAGSIVLTGAGRRTAGTESDLLLEIGNTLTATSVGGRIFIGTVTDVSQTIGGKNDAIQLVANTTLKGTTIEIASKLDSDATARSLTITGDAKLGAIIGGTAALDTISVSGKTDFLAAGTTGAPSVTTVNTQDYTGASTLSENTVLKGSVVTFGGTVNGGKALEIQGDAVLKDSLGNATALASVLVTGKTDFQYAGATATPSVTTTGTQEYQGAATLSADTVLSGSLVTFGSTVDGGKALEIQTDAIFKDLLGNNTALASVLVTGKTDFQAAGSSATPSVTTTGTQAYQGNATLSDNTVLKGSTVTMGSNVNGAKAFEVQGDAVFTKALGNDTALTTVLVTGKTDFQYAGATGSPSVTTTGAQEYQGAATLTGNTVLKGTTVTMGGTVNGAKLLEVQGDAVFKNAIGNTTALTTVNVTGKTDFQAAGTTGTPSVTTTGAQDYQGAATLTGNTVLKGSTVTFNSTVNGAKALEIQGDAVLKDRVGGATALTSVLVTGKTDFQYAGATATPSVTTTGTQEYQGAATLTGNTVLKGSTVTMGGTVNGAKLLEVQGNAVLKGIVGGTTALTTVTVTGKTDFQAAGTTATPSVTTTGAQDYQGAATLTGNTVLKGTTVNMGSTINGAKALEVQGDAVLKGIIGGSTALSSVKITGTTDFQAAGSLATPSVTTTGTQTYQGAATLTADTVLKGTSVDFGLTVDAAVAGDQLLQIVGSASFAGNVGATKQLESIEVSGGTAINATGNLKADKFIKLDANGPITTAGLTTTGITGDILVNQNGGAGTVNIGGDVSATGKYYVTGTSVTLGDASARTQSAAGNVSITATTGNVTQGAGLLTLQSDRNGAGTRPLNVTSTAGKVTLANSALVGGTITGPFTFGHQSDVSVSAFNGAVLNDLHGYDVSVFSNTGTASANWASAANNIEVNGGQASLGLGDGPNAGSAGGYIHVLSGAGASSSSLGTGRAIGDILVYSVAGSATLLTSATSTNSSVTIDAGTLATVGGNVSAKTTYVAKGGTGVVLGDGTARTQTAGGAVTITATTGNVTQGAGLLTVQSDNDGTGSDPLTIKALTGSVTLANSLLAGGTISGSTFGKQSDVIVDAKQNATLIDLRGLNTTVTAQTGNASVTTADAAQAISVTAPGGAASLGTGTAGTSILVSGVSGSLTKGTAGTTISVLGTTGDATLTTGKSGGATLVKSTGANANVVDSTSTGSSITVDANKLATVSGTISAKTTYGVTGGTGVVLGDGTARTQTAGGAVTITATTGNVTQGAGLLTIQSDNDGTGSDPLTIKALTGSVTLANSLLAGGTISGSTFGKQSDVIVDAKQNATLIDLRGLNTTVTAQTGNA
ncbi:filamentous hemagglutinin N-terminal domain-containing protein, partial [Novosphingobium sp.]|uniref:beta strand repeat-containing protein n=1 Tax=Novosphingobium sp. TaxID=1874826 RepID=UPI00286E903F